MTDIKEARVLEVVGYVAQDDIDFKGDCTLRISPYSDYTIPVVRLSDAAAVIDQLRVRAAELEADLKFTSEMLVNVSRNGMTLREELAALKEIPEQAEIAGYKASDGSLMSAESGAMFTAKHMDSYEPLITLAHHNAIVSLLRAKAKAVGVVYTMEALVPGGTVKSHASLNRDLPAGTKLYTRPAHPQNKEEPTHDA